MNLGARGQPLSNFVPVAGRGRQAQAARETLAAISRVHGAATLPTVPVVFDSAIPGDARFVVRTDGTPSQILIQTHSPVTGFALAHEVGHFLDFAAFHAGAGYASEAPADTPVQQALHRVLAAAAASPTFHDLNRLASQSTRAVVGAGGIGYTLPVDRAYVQYNLRVREVFARVYAQYVVVRSGSPILRGQLDEALRAPVSAVYYPVQWPEDQFARLAEALDDLFALLEWRSR